jgi:O-antigen biosynthesis protein
MMIVECVAYFSRLLFLVPGAFEEDFAVEVFQSAGVSYSSAIQAIPLVRVVKTAPSGPCTILALDLRTISVGALDVNQVACTFGSTHGSKLIYEGAVGSIIDAEHRQRRLDAVLRSTALNEIIPDIGLAFLQSSAQRRQAPPETFAIDVRVSGEGAEVIDGWLANFAHQDVALVTSDLRSSGSGDDFTPVERHDVTANLISRGVMLRPGHHHGFSLAMPRLGEFSQPLFFMLREGDSFRLMGPIDVNARQDAIQALQITMDRTPVSSSTDVARAGRNLMLVGGQVRSRTSAGVKRHEFGPVNSADLSIIVCHYGSTFWFASMLQMQCGYPANIEMIHVCDDPSIAREMRIHLESRHSEITCPTILVETGANLGYAGANNVGVGEARAPTVILMNSDIWIDSTLPLFEAADWLEDHPKDVLGFRLLFDDGSLQHDGIEIAREPALGNLYAAHHRSKGLPVRATATLGKTLYQMTDCDAVSGALLAMRRSSFEAIGGLDTSFDWADFEDVDLCLRAREAGGAVKIIQASGLFHLEGQSTREGAALARRRAATVLNALRFNQRWGSKLDARNLSEPTRPFEHRARG